MIRSSRKACGRIPIRMPKRRKGLAVDPSVSQKLDEGYDKLMNSDSKSLLKKHLTPELFQKLKTKRTGTSTLLDCIQSGLIHHDSVCGIYAACPDSYKVFAELFDPIIQDLHLGFKHSDKQPSVDFGDSGAFEDIDPYRNFIASVRMQCARSLRGYPFNPRMTVEHYNEIEDKLHCISAGLQDEFEGEYRSFPRLDKTARAALLYEHRAFKVDDRFLVAANACRHWPTGRGVFRNFDWTFMACCNGEDHLCFTSVQKDGNFSEVYARLIRGMRYVEHFLPFARDDRLGFLTFCPTNLGTALRASVCIKIPKLAAKKMPLRDVAERHKLKIVGTWNQDGFYNIWNRRQIGLTEFNVVSDLYCGVREIIQLEKGEKNTPIVGRRPQPPPPHIDPQKAIKSGLIDDRKKKLPSTASATKPIANKHREMTKVTANLPAIEITAKQAVTKKNNKKFENKDVSAKSASISANTPVAKEVPSTKAELSKEAVGSQLTVASSKSKNPSAAQSETELKSKSKIHKMPIKCLKRRTSKVFSKIPKVCVRSEKKAKKKCKTKASQSTDPCTRAGIKMNIRKNEIGDKSGSSKCMPEKKKHEVPKISKNSEPNSNKSSDPKSKDIKDKKN